MKRYNGAAIILILSALLSACGTRTVPEHERAATLADLKDGSGDEQAPVPVDAAPEETPENVEEYAETTPAEPTPTPFTIPDNIRDNLAPELIRAKRSGNSDAIDAALGKIWEVDAYWAGRMDDITKYWDIANSSDFVNLFPYVEEIRDDVIANGMNTTAFTDKTLFPNGLPEDNSLCFVVAGFELNNNGTPKKEMIDRLIMATGCAQRYPDSYILLTGGPTAMGNPSATEADVMADWLADHGVDRSRLIIENNSMITYENAAFAYNILTRDYPQVKELVIVSSDYHIPMAALLFESECILNYRIDPDLHVIANIGCTTSGYTFGADEQAKQLIYMLSYQ
ncbi:MAG: YdcF family protein [Lachnospiraceae bacterium]|nr:YdcF family protein [Lachnospiraceae bacterium]